MSIALSLTHPGLLARPVRLGWPHAPSRALLGQFVRFSGVGVAATGLQLGLYLPLRTELGPFTANLTAMVLSTLVSIEANRRLTFGRHDRDGLVRQYVGSVAAFVLGVVLSAGALALGAALAPGAGQGVELLLLVAADGVVGIIRFTVLRHWVFVPARSRLPIGA